MPEFMQRWFDNVIDPKSPDRLYLDTLFNVTLYVVIGGWLVHMRYIPGWCYLAGIYPLFASRFILLTHYISHKVPNAWVTFYAAGVMFPFFGLPPDVYRFHHLYMHHTENNQIPWDVSSTMNFQRDRISHFFMYWMRFVFCIWFELPYRTLMRRSVKAGLEVIAKMIFYHVTLYCLYQNEYTSHWCFYTLILPFFFSSFFFMIGNYSQHIFIDPDNFDDNYALTVNCIGTGSNNQMSFNDGYHIIHHYNSRIHWSELPDEYLNTWKEHDDRKALIFQGIDFFGIGFMVLTGQIDALADKYVGTMSKEEVLKTMKHRL